MSVNTVQVTLPMALIKTTALESSGRVKIEVSEEGKAMLEKEITKFISVFCTEELARKTAYIPPISRIDTRTAEDASRRQVSLNLEVHPAYTGLAALLVKHLRVFRYQDHIIQIQMSAIALEVGIDMFTKVPVQLDNSVVMEKVARLIARKGGLLADWRPLPVFEGRTAIDGPHVMMKVAPPPEDPTGQTLGSLLHIVVPNC
ncbi:hypothetical protein CYMTET_5975 [Cymbomonas tetramitiformis]|uniref:Uncharacterized protein n=1 Tax=Cymbomonas tetramitiformis TaxID=36881 RepID=A0AAE0LIJ7_9CHLO|nr:hypothetical protein CYMTET_5975 [Cymbomonas tetramitiformis]